jgi:hypothetical protein
VDSGCSIICTALVAKMGIFVFFFLSLCFFLVSFPFTVLMLPMWGNLRRVRRVLLKPETEDETMSFEP